TSGAAIGSWRRDDRDGTVHDTGRVDAFVRAPWERPSPRLPSRRARRVGRRVPRLRRPRRHVRARATEPARVCRIGSCGRLFPRRDGNEQIGRELAAEFAKMEPLHYFNTVEFPTFDLRGDLRTITAPTLVVVADDDMIAGPVCAEAIVRELPDARLVTIADSG